MGSAKEEHLESKTKEVDVKLSNNDRFKSFVGVLKTGEDIRKKVGARSNDPVSVSETVWGIEAALNIFFTRRGVDIEKSEKKEVTFTVPLANDLVNAVDVYDAYVAMWAEIVNHYDAYQGSDKAFVMADLALESIENNQAFLKLTTVMGDVHAMLAPGTVNCNVFNTGDNWRPGGYYFGLCATPNEPEWVGADDEIEAKMNYFYKSQHLLGPPSETPCQDGFINVETIYDGEAQDYLNSNWQTGDDPLREHLLYWESSNDIGNTCINYENMNWYYCNMIHITEDLTPSGKAFINLGLNTGCLTCNTCTPFCQFLFDITYGEPVWIAGDCPINPYELPTLDPAKDYLQP